MAAVGGAVATITVAGRSFDTLLPYSKQVHHALAGVVVESMLGGGVVLPIQTSPPYYNAAGALDTACAAFTGVAAGWAASRAMNAIA